MKRVFIPVVLAGLLGLAGCSPAADTQSSSPLETKLDHLILPKVPSPTGISVEEALEYLLVKTREVDPDTSSKGINFVLIDRTKGKLGTVSGPQLTEVTVRKALHQIMEAFGMKYRVDSHAVVITPKESPPPVPMPTEADVASESEKRLLHRLSHRVRPHVSFQNCTIEEAVEYSCSNTGCYDLGDALHPSYANVVLHLHNPGQLPTITLDLRDIPQSELLRYIAEIAGIKLGLRSSALVLSNHDLGLPPQAPAKRSALELRASEIILPTVALQDVSLADALEFLRLKIHEFDPTEPLKIIVRPGGGSVIHDLTLKEISLLDVLDHIALQSGHALGSDGRQFILTPKPR